MNLVNVLNYCTGLVGGNGIPTTVGNLVHMIVVIVQIVVPILLVIWGMLDFAKSIIGQDEDKIKAGQKKFIQRLIAAIIVFLIVTVVSLVVNVVGGLGGEGNSANDAWKCASDIINKHEG